MLPLQKSRGARLIQQRAKRRRVNDCAELFQIRQMRRNRLA